ncbi:MAG: GNAT family N-acetyltransferase [Alphaproteobacteria bacterium]
MAIHTVSEACVSFIDALESGVVLRAAEADALSFLLPLSGDYPNIENWYLHKVVPGFRNGTRKLLPIERNGELVGIGIAKNEAGERKICTVRVAPAHFGRGIGLRIFDGLLRWLDVERPHLTISAGKLPAFERIFDYYGFSATSAHKGLYVPHSYEISYNERTCLALPADLMSDLRRFVGGVR